MITNIVLNIPFNWNFRWCNYFKSKACFRLTKRRANSSSNTPTSFPTNFASNWRFEKSARRWWLKILLSHRRRQFQVRQTVQTLWPSQFLCQLSSLQVLRNERLHFHFFGVFSFTFLTEKIKAVSVLWTEVENWPIEEHQIIKLSTESQT